MNIIDVLSKLSVINRDDGRRFTDTHRLDAIAALLWDTRYRRINCDGLFHLYSTRPIDKITEPVFIISTHVDCERGISQCFSEKSGDNMLHGTYDNAITNASAVYLMLFGQLPDNVLVCFTGDEERNAHGARELALYLQKSSLNVRGVVVLDVTAVGWEEEADFTVENNFWDDALGRSVVLSAQNSGFKWMFMPSHVDDIPPYVPTEAVIPEQAWCDESWEYDEMHIKSFSLCIPIKGPMHSNQGVYARASSLERYVQVLCDIAKGVSVL